MTMSDLSNYIRSRKKTDPKFAENFDEGYLDFKIGVTIKGLRKEARLTQEALALMLHTKKSYISRIENQAEDIRLSTLLKIAHVLGKRVDINFLNLKSRRK